jgi:periplasmic protein TonB
MPGNRFPAGYLAFSVLLHMAVVAAAFLVPAGIRPHGDVMVVTLTDIPRAADFLPPRPGVIEGMRPRPEAPPKPAPPPPREKLELPPRPVMRGPVPDLPVDPSRPPEEAFPLPKAETPSAPSPPKEEAPLRPAPDESPARTARAPAEAASPAARAPSRPEPVESPGPTPAGPGKLPSGKDLVPSLGKTVIAMTERGSRGGQEPSRGPAVGTRGPAKEQEGITEERGGGTRLTALNAPEIQYISYFASIKRKIELVWQYPYEAAAAGIQGDLQIDFAIGRNGGIESLTLVRGSGSKILDEEALGAIRKAAPFDPIPSQYEIPHLVIRAHFIYEMHRLRIR